MQKSITLVIIISSILMSRCKSSDSTIQTAIAQTLTAQPTVTSTPIPTITPTNTPTITPSPTFTITPTPTLGIGTIVVSEVDAMVLVYVPAGEFQMGSNISYDTEPVHPVYLDAFWIDQTEVTNQQYAEFLNDLGNQTEGGSSWLDAGSKYVRIHQTEGEWTADSEYSDHPVVEVSWYGASAYCDWAGRKLPTEAMWEKAARGADGRTYPWGEGIDCSLAQYGDCGGGTVPVGSYPDGASPYGALDITGNVQEWVADLYDINYYSNSPFENPQGPSIGYYVVPLKPPLKHYRVLRDGAYNSVGWGLQAAARGGAPPEGSYPGVGFRCVLAP
ncbi:MAG: hypothetical protein E3J88_03520 [Anaerolineales bacterium]|nr:MAG: hypothetical protein E3J88_03520 [Anaerolineales bacterium]